MGRASVKKKNGIAYPLDGKPSSTANVFRLMLLARFPHRPMIHMLLPLFCINFIRLQRVFPTYFIYWIAAYPVDNGYLPFEQLGQVELEFRNAAGEQFENLINYIFAARYSAESVSYFVIECHSDLIPGFQFLHLPVGAFDRAFAMTALLRENQT